MYIYIFRTYVYVLDAILCYKERRPPFPSPVRFVAFKTVFNTPAVLCNNMTFTDDDIIIY